LLRGDRYDRQRETDQKYRDLRDHIQLARLPSHVLISLAESKQNLNMITRVTAFSMRIRPQSKEPSNLLSTLRLPVCCE
jgi:hypothetical protein